MGKPTKITTPKHLTGRARAFFQQIAKDFELEGHHVECLLKAAEQLSRAEVARRIVDVEGLTIKDRFNQPREHPAVAVERAASTTFARLVRELGLDLPPQEFRVPRR